jgi:alpha-glucosidase (family GH31 glycosyl hydrolase)
MDIDLKITSSPHLFGDDVPQLKVKVDFETEDRLHVKVIDPSTDRWEIPESILPTPPSNGAPAQLNYKFSYTSNPFGLAVTRTSDGSVLFNTSTSRSLIFEENYIEVSTLLNANGQPNIYGFGEHTNNLKLDSNEKTYTMWSLDAGSPPDQNLYGVHPFYMELRNGAAHGVFLKNSNAMEVTLKADSLTYHVLGGVLDFYFFTGNTPELVAQQYHQLIGFPYFNPFWTLGWHQCRWGIKNLSSLEEVVSQYKKNNIPLDVVWSDIDYMQDHRDFSWDSVNYPESQVKQFVDGLHQSDMKYVVIVDPGIPYEKGYAPYDQGVEKNVFIKNSNGNIFVGKVWPGYTAYPDFTHPNASDFWYGLVSEFMNGVDVDGLWIDMNEVSNFCDGDCNGASSTPLNNPAYVINNGNNRLALNVKTLDMDAVQYAGLQYDLHSMYGMTEQIVTKSVLEKVKGKRAFSLSRSTFAGSGKHGAHWLGDNYSTWESMKASIPGAILMNLFGIPMVGADICGFIYSTTEELCVRWHAFGTFFPFARNHNEINAKDQYPYLWPSVQAITIKTLNARYSLVFYYYTLLYNAHISGGTVLRALLTNFPQDPKVLPIQTQFMIGDSLLVSPCLEQDQRIVTAYFPNAVWYDFWTGAKTMYNQEFVVLDAPLDVINVHIKGGSVLPMKKPELTLPLTTQNPFEILIALDENNAASGELFIDDGEQLDVSTGVSFFKFTVQNKVLQTTAVLNGYSGNKVSAYVSKIQILGLNGIPSAFSVQGAQISSSSMSFNSTTHVLNVILPAPVAMSKLQASWQ